MRKTVQKAISFYLFLFLLPIIFVKIPILAFEPIVKEQVETRPVAYAANVTKEVPLKEENAPLQALLVFTHSHEAFHPIIKKEIGVIANYHSSSNITNISDLVTKHFLLNNVEVDVLPFDNMTAMKNTNRQFHEAYSAIRPVLQKQLGTKSYDLVLDVHRDSAKHKVTTITSNNESYARIALVVGTEHPSYKMNESYAQLISQEMNRLIPNISRGVITKSKDSGNGIYNQDLSPHSILIELGGIENTEEEINRTIAVIAKAISIAFENTKAT
ncbi:MAG: stage II sporulation protein P [Planococcaceae bacterium]|nr:stage II sporulation protein P [Bacillota bacterium]MDX1770263.1 stage II sporulation protein P [Planococcaceae bacterium]